MLFFVNFYWFFCYSGKVYLSDTKEQQLLILDRSGKQLAQFGATPLHKVRVLLQCRGIYVSYPSLRNPGNFYQDCEEKHLRHLLLDFSATLSGRTIWGGKSILTFEKKKRPLILYHPGIFLNKHISSYLSENNRIYLLHIFKSLKSLNVLINRVLLMSRIFSVNPEMWSSSRTTGSSSRTPSATPSRYTAVGTKTLSKSWEKFQSKYHVHCDAIRREQFFLRKCLLEQLKQGI